MKKAQTNAEINFYVPICVVDSYRFLGNCKICIRLSSSVDFLNCAISVGSKKNTRDDCETEPFRNISQLPKLFNRYIEESELKMAQSYTVSYRRQDIYNFSLSVSQLTDKEVAKCRYNISKIRNVSARYCSAGLYSVLF